MKASETRLQLSEAQFQAMIVDLAHARGWLVHHDRGDYRQCIAGDPGFPDLVLGRGESVLFFEVKSEKGKVTAAQREWSYNLSSHFVVRPSDWPHVQAVLK